MWAYSVPGRNPTILPVNPGSRASTALYVASTAVRISLTPVLPASSQLVGCTEGGAWQALSAAGAGRAGGGGKPTDGRAGSSLAGDSLGVAVAVGCGVGVLVGAGVAVAVGTGVFVIGGRGGSSSSSARLTEAGVGRIKERVSATATSRRLTVLEEVSSIMRTGAECCRWSRQRASPRRAACMKKT